MLKIKANQHKVVLAWLGVMLLSLLLTLLATAPAARAEPAVGNACSLAVSVEGNGRVEQQLIGGGDGAFRVEIGPNRDYVLLENAEIRAVYEPFFENHAQFSIRQFYVKAAGFQDQVDRSIRSAYLDADAGRGTLKNAVILYDGADRKTLRLVWHDRSSSREITHEVTIYPTGRYLQIRYVNVQAGTNTVDLGRPGGEFNGRHVVYGAENWIRGYVTHDYEPTVGSYYNRYPGDGVNDPANGGSLNYKGHFIMGVYNPANGVGFGRVMPVADVSIVKLLLTNTQRRGLENFPHPFNRAHAPFTGYLYALLGGESDAIAYGRQLVDGNLAQAVDACGDAIRLTAVPDDGWRFERWSGDLSGSANPAVITLAREHRVTAHFAPVEEPVQYTLTVQTEGEGSVQVAPLKESYTAGEEVTLTAVPGPGWRFANWSGGLGGEANPQTLTMTGDTAVTANFAAEQYTLEVNLVPADGGGGRVRVTPEQSTYAYGDEVMLSAIPANGWRFGGWSGGLSGTDPSATLTITADSVVTATFVLIIDRPYRSFFPLAGRTVQTLPND